MKTFVEKPLCYNSNYRVEKYSTSDNVVAIDLSFPINYITCL